MKLIKGIFRGGNIINGLALWDILLMTEAQFCFSTSKGKERIEHVHALFDQTRILFVLWGCVLRAFREINRYEEGLV